jgi:hypothetical protein
MQDAAVVAGLVTSRPGFLLNNQNLNVGIAAYNLVSGGKAYNSGTRDCNFHPAAPFLRVNVKG